MLITTEVDLTKLLLTAATQDQKALVYYNQPLNEGVRPDLWTFNLTGHMKPGMSISQA